MRGRGWGLGRRADGSMKRNWRSGGVGGESTEEFKYESTSMKAERNRKLKPFPKVTNYFRVLLSDVTKYHQLASATFQFFIIEVKKRCDFNSTNTKQCPWCEPMFKKHEVEWSWWWAAHHQPRCKSMQVLHLSGRSWILMSSWIRRIHQAEVVLQPANTFQQLGAQRYEASEVCGLQRTSGW